jgi:hypothetical protein
MISFYQYCVPTGRDFHFAISSTDIMSRRVVYVIANSL